MPKSQGTGPSRLGVAGRGQTLGKVRRPPTGTISSTGLSCRRLAYWLPGRQSGTVSLDENVDFVFFVRKDVMKMLFMLLLLEMMVTAAAHGAVTIPKPRQAVDGTLAPWNGSVPAYPIPFDTPNWCESPSANTIDPRHYTGSNGQACFCKFPPCNAM